MRERSDRRVVVGIGAQDEVDAMLDVATDEAERRGCGIELVHVVPSLDVILPASAEQLALADSTVRKTGQSRLYRAEQRLRERLQAPVAVETHLAQGAVVPCLVERSAEASMVVVQRGPRLRRGFATVAHLAGVAAHAHAPVTCVPSSWRRSSWEERPVCVGVEPDPAPAVVRMALQRARGTTGRLRMVCAPGLGMVGSGREGESWSAYVDEVVRGRVGTLLDEFPDVAVEVVAWRGRPVDALLAESRESSALVLGRHHHLMPAGSHLGSVVTTILREGACPVIVVDPLEEGTRSRRSAGWARPTAATGPGGRP